MPSDEARSAYLTNTDKVSPSGSLSGENVVPVKYDFERDSFNLWHETKHYFQHDKKCLRHLNAMKLFRTKLINYNNVVIYFNYHCRSKGSAGGFAIAKIESDSDRARMASKQLALERIQANINEWSYFATFTLDEKKQDRNNFELFRKRLTKFFRRRGVKFFYVPEFHEKGGIHVHALLSADIKPYLAQFEGKALKNRYIHSKIVAQQPIYNCPDYARAFGFCTIEPIRDVEACSLYITKYVVKTFDDENFKRISHHRFFCSQGLRHPVFVLPTNERLKFEEFDLVAVSSHTTKCYLRRRTPKSTHVALDSMCSRDRFKRNGYPYPIKQPEQAGITAPPVASSFGTPPDLISRSS